VALLMYADDGYCESFIEESGCRDARTAGGYFAACKWRSDNESCEFNPPTIDAVTSIVLTFIVAICSVPFDQFWKYCVYNIVQFIQKKISMKQRKVNLIQNPLSHQNDEFCDVQTLQSTIMRAARLDKARRTMDLVSIKSEALSVRDKIIQDYERLQNLQVFGNVVQHLGLLNTRYGGDLLKKNVPLSRRVELARKKASLIAQELAAVDSCNPEAREELLVKYFIVEFFTGYKRKIVSKYFLGNKNVLTRSWYPEQQQWFCLCAFPCYAAFMIYFISALNVSIGSRSTNIWLLIVLLSFLQDTFVLEPTKIWVTWMLINRQVSQEVRTFCETLAKKSRIILRRTTGLVRDSNAMVQHFNPACRVARMYPALPISRLLMSVNDYDIPLHPNYNWFGWVAVSLSATVLAIAFLPEVLQESVLDIATSSTINFILLGFAALGSYSLWIAGLLIIFLATFLLFCVFGTNGNVYLCCIRLKSFVCGRKNKVAPVMYVDEELAEEMEPEPAIGKINFPQKEKRIGLFDKQSQVKLKEGHLRIFQHRVTQMRAFRSLNEMNRKFDVVAPVDSEVIDYLENVSSRSSDEEAKNSSKTEKHSNRKRQKSISVRKANAAEDHLAVVDIESDEGIFRDIEGQVLDDSAKVFVKQKNSASVSIKSYNGDAESDSGTAVIKTKPSILQSMARATFFVLRGKEDKTNNVGAKRERRTSTGDPDSSGSDD
jgi:hypothetical protein